MELKRLRLGHQYGICIALMFVKVLLSIGTLSAQKTPAPFKIDKVKVSDFTRENVAVNEHSDALFFYDLGHYDVQYGVREYPETRITRNMRFRVLNQDGIDYATQSLMIEKYDGREQSLVAVKGGVYNLENGKIEFKKLNKEDWTISKVGDLVDMATIRCPGVEVGSIVEIEYVFLDPFFYSLDQWNFQYSDASVAHSEFTLAFPEVMDFRQLKFGLHPLFCPPIYTKGLIPGEPGTTDSPFEKESYRYICKDVPPLIDEPLVDSKENYRSKIVFELDGMNVIAGNLVELDESWIDISNEIQSYGVVKSYLKPKDKSIIFKVDREEDDILANIKSIRNHIVYSYHLYDDDLYYLPLNRCGDVIADKRLTARDINWLLIATLRANNIEARPVMLSDRTRQRLHQEFPLRQLITDMVVAVNVEGDYQLMDLSTGQHSIGEIPKEFMNGNGLVLKENEVEWLALENSQPAKRRVVIDFDNLEAGTLTGTMKVKLQGSYAMEYKEQLRTTGYSANQLLETCRGLDLTQENQEKRVDGQTVELEFAVSYKMNEENGAYVLPVSMFDQLSVNPLAQKSRVMPIMFPECWSQEFICMVSINPEKFSVELPEDLSVSLPERLVSHQFSTRSTLDKLIIRDKLEVRENRISPGMYHGVKQIYDSAISVDQKSILIRVNK